MALRVEPWASALIALAVISVGSPSGATPAPAEPATVIADIDLAQPFHARSPWRLTITQGPEAADPDLPGQTVPGAVTICLRKRDSNDCADLPPPPAPMNDPYWSPHYLDDARVVHSGAGGPLLLLLRLASIHSGDGDQAVFTRLLAYRPAQDQFEPVYAHMTGRNNNQDVRFIASGKLAGAVVSVEPTETAPFVYWVTVDRPDTEGL
jgi:hypothetical protein